MNLIRTAVIIVFICGCLTACGYVESTYTCKGQKQFDVTIRAAAENAEVIGGEGAGYYREEIPIQPGKHYTARYFNNFSDSWFLQANSYGRDGRTRSQWQVEIFKKSLRYEITVRRGLETLNPTEVKFPGQCQKL